MSIRQMKKEQKYQGPITSLSLYFSYTSLITLLHDRAAHFLYFYTFFYILSEVLSLP